LEVTHRAVGVYRGEREVAFAVVSVKLFRVVLFPELGFPTRPMRGSRGMLRVE